MLQKPIIKDSFVKTEEKNMSKVTFDYSKVSSFISDEEVVNMKKIAEDAKKVLLEFREIQKYWLLLVSVVHTLEQERLSSF